MKHTMMILGMLAGLTAGCAASTPAPAAPAVASAPKMQRIYDYCESGCKDDACTHMCNQMFHKDPAHD
jgi:hypothetical protein